MPQIKNCRTCAHCNITDVPSLDYCFLTGNYCRTQRINPEKPCDANFSGWEPRTPTQYLMDHRFSIVFVIASISVIIIIIIFIL